MNREITVSTGARLHFGLIGWGPEHARQFGGLGVMVAPPSLVVRVSPARRFSIIGPLTDRAAAVVTRLVRHWELAAVPPCRIEVLSLLPEHAGLGTGTALTLAIASALAQFLQLENVPLEELALATGRGLRSAVGAHGFASGGLIYEDGKAPGESLGRLRACVALPRDWRFVLIRTSRVPGLAGSDERRAFELVRSTPLSTAEQLRELAENTILPAARAGDFNTFATGIADYNRLAGSYFSTLQPGNYASAEIAELIVSLQQRGVPGAGQSSWGPTAFAIVQDEPTARELATWLIQDRGDDVTIATPL